MDDTNFIFFLIVSIALWTVLFLLFSGFVNIQGLWYLGEMQKKEKKNLRFWKFWSFGIVFIGSIVDKTMPHSEYPGHQWLF